MISRKRIEFSYHQQQQIEKMAGAGVSMTQVARLLGVSRYVVSSNFGKFWDRYRSFPKDTSHVSRLEATPEMREKVASYARAVLTHPEIAKLMGISEEVLRREFGAELELSKLLADAVVGNSLVREAQKGNVTAIIWHEKTRRGFKEPAQKLEHAGAIAVEAGDVLQTLMTELRKLPPEAREKIDAALAVLEAAGATQH
jgi:transposase-like protein